MLEGGFDNARDHRFAGRLAAQSRRRLLHVLRPPHPLRMAHAARVKRLWHGDVRERLGLDGRGRLARGDAGRRRNGLWCGRRGRGQIDDQRRCFGKWADDGQRRGGRHGSGMVRARRLRRSLLRRLWLRLRASRRRGGRHGRRASRDPSGLWRATSRRVRTPMRLHAHRRRLLGDAIVVLGAHAAGDHRWFRRRRHAPPRAGSLGIERPSQKPHDKRGPANAVAMPGAIRGWKRRRSQPRESTPCLPGNRRAMRAPGQTAARPREARARVGHTRSRRPRKRTPDRWRGGPEG